MAPAEQGRAIRRAIGARLRAERKARRWPQPVMAGRLAEHVNEQCPDPTTLTGYVKRWERGGSGISERYRFAYAAAFEIPEEELFTLVDDAEQPVGAGVPENAPLGVVASAAGRFFDITVPTHAKDDDVRRRAALELFAALGIGAGAFGTSGSWRHLLDLALTSEPRSLDDWHIACADHLHAIRTRPPAQVQNDLLLDLLTVRRQIDIGSSDITELQRILAALATLDANVLTRLGEHGSALRWWRTARAAADATGDLDLRLLVRGAEAGFGLYGQRSPGTVLHLTRNARRIAGDRPSLGRHLVNVAEVKALSLLGRHQEAKARLRSISDAAPDESHKSPIPTYWTGDQIHFTQSWVYAHAGDQAAADEARERLLTYGMRLDYQYSANVHLHEALCTVVNGGIDAGARQATEILATLPNSQRSHMIIETGRTVLRAVPIERQGRACVRDLHVLTSRPNLAALT